MGVSLLEVINAAGYDLTTLDDARWFLSKVTEFEEIVQEVEDLIEAHEEIENGKSEAEYKEWLERTA